MKRILLLLAAFALLAGCAKKKQPVECLVPQDNVELTGNGFQVFSPGADLKLVAVPNPDNAGEWMIRASLPLKKLSASPIGDTQIDLNLLDENGMKIRDGFYLTAQDLGNLIPKFNTGNEVENNVVFTAADDSRKYFSRKEAADLLARVKAVAMNINLVQNDPQVAVDAPAANAEPVTFQSLMEKYGVYGLLSQYDKALSKKEKKKAKGIEDNLYAICKKVKADPAVPESLAKRFRDYIENKEDEIEDKY